MSRTQDLLVACGATPSPTRRCGTRPALLGPAALGVALLSADIVAAQNRPSSHYEAALLAEADYPSGVSAMDWFPDDYEVQGVANDGKNWFFTIVDQDQTHGILWRIPKAVPLN